MVRCQGLVPTCDCSLACVITVDRIRYSASTRVSRLAVLQGSYSTDRRQDTSCTDRRVLARQLWVSSTKLPVCDAKTDLQPPPSLVICDLTSTASIQPPGGKPV